MTILIKIKIKKLNIDSPNDIKQLSGYVTKLKSLSAAEDVGLVLAHEIEIAYNDSILIKIQLSQKKYCIYINKDKNISYLSKMPNGLYEWVEEKIK